MMNKNVRLNRAFYTGTDVVDIARELLGKHLYSFAHGQLTSGIITETEAYNGVTDKASHAYGDRKTKRTATMYKEGGVAYIYFCYGIHSLLNVVTNFEGTPHAVLIRSIFPIEGKEIMAERIGRKITEKEGTGPGKVTKLLGLTYADDGADLINGSKLWIEDHGLKVPYEKINITPRIGVAYAREDALLPYRFVADYRHFIVSK